MSTGIAAALSVGTRSGHCTHLRAWIHFCDDMKIDPADFPLAEGCANRLVAEFAGYEFMREMHPWSIRGYMAGIATGMEERGWGTGFRKAMKSRRVHSAIEGFCRIYFRRHPQSETRRSEFTADASCSIEEAMQGHNDRYKVPQLERDSQVLAARLGIWFCLRLGDFLRKNKNGVLTEGICWKCVRFMDKSGRLIKFKDLGWRYGEKDVARVTINIMWSKTDRTGAGRVRQLTRNPLEDGQCIVSELAKWAIRCKLKRGATIDDHIFVIRGVPIITSNQLANTMKTTARFLGMNDKRISVHSLRYGGAVTMASAGIPRELIEYHGGWVVGSAALSKYLSSICNINKDTDIARVMAESQKECAAESRFRDNGRFGERA